MDLLVISVLLLGGVWVFVRSYRTSSTSVTRTATAVASERGQEHDSAALADVVSAATQAGGALHQPPRHAIGDVVVPAAGSGRLVPELHAMNAAATVHGTYHRVDVGHVAERVSDHAKVYAPPRTAASSGATSGRLAPQRSRLDDLLRNAVPIDHVTPQLPVDLNLYGRAQSPQQYRADIEHTTIAAPHFERSRTRVQGNVAESRLSRIVQAEGQAMKASGISAGPVTSRHDGNGT